jgi:hypothetical protein
MWMLKARKRRRKSSRRRRKLRVAREVSKVRHDSNPISPYNSDKIY